ncbi:tektin-4-like [Halyomorpha halys]|uniref:tektin-4-like n=1 Tax=Halyomorpha halys TaxID=286706 RepID=UPI0034D25407
MATFTVLAPDVSNVKSEKSEPASLPQTNSYPVPEPGPESPVAPQAMGKDVGKVERGKGTEPKPAFLPQKLDNYPAPEPGPMGPIGPWATGKVDWNPMAGITGTRPVVDHYSITRYSDGEWRKHNEEVLCCTADDLHRVNIQSSEEGWEKHTRELLGLAAAVRGQSAELRALLDGPILQDAMRDLKQQAETVDITLARGVADLEQCIGAMHQELAVVVRRNAESETLIYDLQQGIRGLDKAMKVAQTRLDNYQMRPGVENCRDKSMFSLIDEVKSLGEQSTSMKGQLQEAEEALLNLINSRSTLEKELKNKLKTLDIDRNRCQACRSQYPTATAMSGF